jgi:translocation and assembly module TamB
MNRRWVKIILFSTVLVAALPLWGIYGVLHTTSGARLLLSLIENQMNDSLEIKGVQGNFSSGLDIDRIAFRDPELGIILKKTRFVLEPGGFPLRVHINYFEISSVQIQQRNPAADSAQSAAVADLAETLASLASPYPIIITRLEVGSLETFDSSGVLVLTLDNISSALQLHDVLDIDHLALESSRFSGELQGSLGLSAPFPVSLNIKTSLALNGDVMGNRENIDAQASLHGDLINSLAIKITTATPELTVNIQLQDVLRKDRLEMPLMQIRIPDSGARLDATAFFDLDAGVVEADLTWKDIAWPIIGEEPEFLSSAGKVQLSGSPGNWVLQGDTTIQTAGFPPGQLQLEASGNRDSAAIKIVDSQVLGSNVNGHVELNWLRELNWSARLNANGIETGILFPDWAGSLNTKLEASGATNPFQLELDILQLDGEIREYPLTASGQIHLQGNDQFDANIQLATGNSSLNLKGSLFGSEGLMFSAMIDDLNTFLPAGSGSVEMNGQVFLLPGKPRLRLDLEAEQLGWSGISVHTLSIHDSSGPSENTIADLQVVARQIGINGHLLDKINLDIFADQENLSARLNASDSKIEIVMKLSGAMNDWLHITGAAWAEAAWAGQVDSMTLSNDDREVLHLYEPAPLQLSMDKTMLEEACLGTTAAQNICLSTHWQKNGAYSVNANLLEFPLNMVQKFFENDLLLTQKLSGNLQFTGAHNLIPAGQARFEISPGRFSINPESDTSMETGAGTVEFSLEHGKLLTGSVDLPLPGHGKIDIDFQLPDVADGEEIEIDGHAEITLNNLGVFSASLPFFDRMAGKFDARLDVSGDVLNPDLSGNISIENGLLQHDASGLKLSEIQLAGNFLGGGKSALSGSFKAREGVGELQADIDLSDVLSPRFKLTLSGENLVLFNSPELLLVAEPDIQLGWRDNSLEINGRILIPKARIAPKTIPVSSNSESEDLVIVAGEIPGSDKDNEPDQELAIRGDLEIVLGENIELDLGLAVAQLDGSATFSWQDKLLPTATGQYGIVGEINAFGQQLSITSGAISFHGGPADNPHLDIRAERRIFGNSEIHRAGVFVGGTLKRMILEPYTDPMTTRERAQTLLITGSDFNMEQGVGAVNIGTYIAPRVYLSYGIGVFEDENVISLRYDLGNRWGIKVTSGQRTNGIDINYIIER